MAAALLAVAACGGPQPSIVLSLGSDAVVLVRGDEASVEVTLTRVGGVDGAVTLDVTGRPANVEASFAPAVLSGDTLTSTLTLTAEAAASEGAYDLSVVATGPGLAAGAALQLEVVSLTVKGRIASLPGASPAAIQVGSQGVTAVSDEDGGFELSGLSVPYDVAVWDVADPYLHVFQGLTESEVVIGPGKTFGVPEARSATVSGTLTGEHIPVEAQQRVLICVEGLDGYARGCGGVDPFDSGFTLTVDWWGPETRSVRLHLLQVETDAGGVMVGYPGYGSVDAVLTDAMPLALPSPIDLGGPLETATVHLEVESPAAIASSKFSAVQVGQDATLRLDLVYDAVAGHDFVMPVIDGASYTFVAAVALDRFAWVSGVTGSDATIALPEYPVLVSPENLAVNVTPATEFTVADPNGGPLTWTWYDVNTDYRVQLTTMSTTVTMPDTSAYGFALPAGADFAWYVAGSAGDGPGSSWVGAVDQVNVLSLTLFGGSPAFAGDGYQAQTGPRGFTTAP